MRWKTIFAIVSLQLLVGVVAAADKTPEKAKAAFGEGTELFTAGDYRGAADAFRLANEIAPNWKILYNIGQSEAAARRYGLALQAFERYLAEGGDEIPGDRQKEVLNEVDRLRRMVGSVEVTAPPGAMILVDEVNRGQAPLPGALLVSAGLDHRIVVEKEGRTLLEKTIRVSGGQKTSVIVGAEPASSDVEAEQGEEPVRESGGEEEDAAPAEDSDDDRSNLWKAGWAVAAVGGATLIAGGAVGGAMLSLDGDLTKKCDQGICDPSDQGDLEKRDNLALSADVLYGVGGAALIAGVVMIIVAARRGEREGGGEITLSPSAGPGFAGVTLGGRF